MSILTIVVTPDDSDDRAILKIEVGESAPRILELTLKASGGEGLSPNALSAIDLKSLLTALLPAMGGAATAAPVTDVADRSMPYARVRTAAATAGRPASRNARISSSKSVNAPSGTGRAAAGTRTSRTPPAGRAYRTIPEDFIAQHGKSTLAGLAEIYDVPLYTVQGWVSTARRQGRIPPARPRKK